MEKYHTVYESFEDLGSFFGDDEAFSFISFPTTVLHLLYKTKSASSTSHAVRFQYEVTRAPRVSMNTTCLGGGCAIFGECGAWRWPLPPHTHIE